MREHVAAMIPPPPKGAGPAADKGEDRDAGLPHLENGAYDLSDRKLASIGFLEPDAARVHQQHHGLGRASLSRSRAAWSRPLILPPETSAKVPPMNWPSWAATKTLLAVDRPWPTTTPSSKAPGQVEQGQMRAHLPLFGADEFMKAPGSSNPATAGTGGPLQPTFGEGV